MNPVLDRTVVRSKKTRTAETQREIGTRTNFRAENKITESRGNQGSSLKKKKQLQKGKEETGSKHEGVVGKNSSGKKWGVKEMLGDIKPWGVEYTFMLLFKSRSPG